MTSRASTPSIGTAADRDSARIAEELKRVGDALRGLQFGTVTLIVQDGVVVQVDRTEKIRLVRQPTQGA